MQFSGSTTAVDYFGRLIYSVYAILEWNEIHSFNPKGAGFLCDSNEQVQCHCGIISNPIKWVHWVAPEFITPMTDIGHWQSNVKEKLHQHEISTQNMSNQIKTRNNHWNVRIMGRKERVFFCMGNEWLHSCLGHHLHRRVWIYMLIRQTSNASSHYHGRTSTKPISE